jgi:hypothetical protein
MPYNMDMTPQSELLNRTTAQVLNGPLPVKNYDVLITRCLGVYHVTLKTAGIEIRIVARRTGEARQWSSAESCLGYIRNNFGGKKEIFFHQLD